VTAIGVAALVMAGRTRNPRGLALWPPLRPWSCIDLARALYRDRTCGRPAERTRRRA